MLTPAEAEAVVEDHIQEFGLGALPKVRVALQPDGGWRVQWTTHVATCPPMSLPVWKRWLVDNVGDLDAERLETSEG